MPLVKEYEGVIVFQAPPENTFTGSPKTRDQFYELSRKQLQEMIPRLLNKPIVTEHGHQQVGTITGSALDVKGSASVRFRLSSDAVGENARRLIESGLFRGLSLCHRRDTLEPQEVSICMEGARPDTGITGDVMVAASKTNAPRYISPGTVHSFVPGRLYVPASAVSAVPTGPSMSEAPNRPPSSTKPSATVNDRARVTLSRDEQDLIRRHRESQQPMNNAKETASVTHSDSAAMSTSSPAVSAPGFPAPVGQPASGHGHSIPLSAAMAFANLAAGKQQQTVEPPAATAPQQGTKRVAPGKKEEEEETDEKQPSDSVQPPPAKKSRADTPATNDGGRDDVLQLLEKKEALSENEKIRLLDAMTKDLQTRQSLEKQLKDAQEQLKTSQDTSRSMQQQFQDTMIPFMKQMLPSHELTESQERQMRQAAQNPGALAFLEKWTPAMVKASTLALERISRQENTRQSELSKRMAFYNALRQGTSTTTSATAMPPSTVAASFAVSNQIPAQAPASLTPPVVPSGWTMQQPHPAPIPQQVAASSSSAPAGLPPRDPFALSPEVAALLKNNDFGDQVAKKDFVGRS